MSQRRSRSPYPYLETGGSPVVLAHRGGARTDDNVENTVAAFRSAIGYGCAYVETDMQATTDGELVLFHDVTLDRLVGRAGRIGDLRWDEVAKLDVSGHPIPRLSDVLEEFPTINFNIDAKERESIPALARIVDRHQAWDRVCVASFSALRMRQIRRVLGPRVATSLTPFGVATMRFVRGSRLRRHLVRAGAAVQVPVRRGPIEIVTPRFIRTVHERGLPVHVWTVDDPREMERLLDLGVDGIITDRVDVARDVFVARGLWTGRTA